MAFYWRRRPTMEAIHYAGDRDALEAWIVATIGDGCERIDDLNVMGDADSFRVEWDEGYVGAETTWIEGVTGDLVAWEDCWLRAYTQEVFDQQFEPVTD